MRVCFMVPEAYVKTDSEMYFTTARYKQVALYAPPQLAFSL